MIVQKMATTPTDKGTGNATRGACIIVFYLRFLPHALIEINLVDAILAR